MQYFPAALQNLADQFARLPGIGGKTAQRLAFHVLELPLEDAQAFADAIMEAKRDVHCCPVCQNLTDRELCPICDDDTRDHSLICVVAEPKDVIAMERSREFNGVYHVLGGVISPMDGIGPDQLEINSLVERVNAGDVKEVILALSATMEGETTNFYIFRKLGSTQVKITQLARGVSVGNEIEYTDEITLGRSLLNRTLFSDSFNSGVL